jgi:hypothetical protein
MMQTIRSVADGLEQRLGLWQALGPSVTHPVPRDTASWWYVFGSVPWPSSCCKSPPASPWPWCMCH